MELIDVSIIAWHARPEIGIDYIFAITRAKLIKGDEEDFASNLPNQIVEFTPSWTHTPSWAHYDNGLTPYYVEVFFGTESAPTAETLIAVYPLYGHGKRLYEVLGTMLEGYCDSYKAEATRQFETFKPDLGVQNRLYSHATAQ